MSEILDVQCYVEAYTVGNQETSVRLRDKKTDTIVQLRFTNGRRKQAYRQFLQRALRRDTAGELWDRLSPVTIQVRGERLVRGVSPRKQRRKIIFQDTKLLTYQVYRNQE